MPALILAFFAILFLVGWVATLTRWRRGLDLLLLYIPFAGALVLWSGHHPVALLAKDILFVAPLYFAAFAMDSGRIRRVPVPTRLVVPVALLATLVILQSANPQLANPLMALVGIKVWLFYVPLTLLVAASIETPLDLRHWLRVMTVASLLPLVVGPLQWVASEALGYRATMVGLYGEAGVAATQNLAQFEYGAAYRRLPGTFSNSFSYFLYSLVMMTVGYAQSHYDNVRRWRLLGTVVLLLAALASFASGIRAAFLLTPMVLMLQYLLGSRFGGTLRVSVLLVCLVLGLGYAVGLDRTIVVSRTTSLAYYYAGEFFWTELRESLTNQPWGAGTGKNTLGARYVGETLKAESLLGKTINELGLPGLMVLLVFLAALIGQALHTYHRVHSPPFRAVAAAFASILCAILVMSLKSRPMYTEPTNVYFWVWLGLVLKLPQLDAVARGLVAPAPAAGRARAAPRGAPVPGAVPRGGPGGRSGPPAGADRRPPGSNPFRRVPERGPVGRPGGAADREPPNDDPR